MTSARPTIGLSWMAVPTSAVREVFPARPSPTQLAKRWRNPAFLYEADPIVRVFATSRLAYDRSWQADAVFDLIGDVWSNVEFQLDEEGFFEPPPRAPTTWRFHWAEDAVVSVPREVFDGAWVDVAIDAALSSQRDTVRTIAAEHVPARVLSLAVAIIMETGRRRRRWESKL